jgi:hypothetical protein
MRKACNTHDRTATHIGFGGKAKGKETTRKTRT